MSQCKHPNNGFEVSFVSSGMEKKVVVFLFLPIYHFTFFLTFFFTFVKMLKIQAIKLKFGVHLRETKKETQTNPHHNRNRSGRVRISKTEPEASKGQGTSKESSHLFLCML